MKRLEFVAINTYFLYEYKMYISSFELLELIFWRFNQ